MEHVEHARAARWNWINSRAALGSLDGAVKRVCRKQWQTQTTVL